MGKSSVNGPFSIAMLVYQRVILEMLGELPGAYWMQMLDTTSPNDSLSERPIYYRCYLRPKSDIKMDAPSALKLCRRSPVCGSSHP